jgi:hypothetical protein
MPYINKARRESITEDGPKTPGELNYIFTAIALDYIQRMTESYQHYNDVIGALEGAKLELYRRQVSPYEDKAMAKNGDIEI